MSCEREDETRQNPVPPDSHRLSPISARRFCQNTALSFALRLTHAPYDAPYAVKHAVRRVVKDLGPILQVALLCHHDGRGRRVVADVKFHTLCAASNWKTGSGRCGLSGNLRTSTSILLSYTLLCGFASPHNWVSYGIVFFGGAVGHEPPFVSKSIAC